MRKLILIFICLFLAIPSQAGIIYVDADANGLNTGSSWADAYNYLQDALTAASSGDEIRVAQGIYKPDQGAGVTPGDREATFQLINGVTLKGGYAGFGQPDPNARDIELYETILTGDLNDDDGPNFYNNAENSYHVVTGSETDATALLDGFTVTGGNANGSYSNNTDKGGGMYTENGSPRVVNCTFRGNSANHGGGMCNRRSTLMVTNCTFSGNLTSSGGGGIYCRYSSSTITNCRFINNSAPWGGGMENAFSNPTLTNCTLSGNSAEAGGAGVDNGIGCTPTLINCMFTSNSAGYNGGGMHSAGRNSSPTLLNCTFSRNTARGKGGGMYNSWGDPRATNCIFWANKDCDGVDESAQVQIENTVARIEYCCIQGWTGRLGGTRNIDADPRFIDAANHDCHLLPGSPCIDAGNNTKVPPSVVVDLDGNPRFDDDPDTADTGSGTPPIVDMGAYEGPHQGFLLSTNSVIVQEEATAMFTVALPTDPLGTVNVTTSRVSGDPDITVYSGASLTFDSSNYSRPQPVTLAALKDGDKINGVAVIRISSSGFVTAEVRASEEDNDPIPKTLFVDMDACLGANNGTSWADAFTDLQGALTVAATFPEVQEIRVAQGLYTPTEPSGNRMVTFQLVTSVAIHGGYAGFDEPDPNARDVKVYKTILSGDLNGDDVGNLEDPSRAENSYHVVTAIGANETTLLEGFTITGGNANGSTADNRHGGGLHISQSTDLTLTNCTFATNSAGGGGGLYNDSFNLMLTNCTFIGNSAGSGGGMELHGDQTTLINCIFSGNSAINGGGIDCPCTEVSLTNCTFVGNTASSEYNYRGGGICGDDDTVMRLTNCIFWANRDIDGMGQAAQIDHDSFPQTHVNFCCIQGWTGDLGGTGNINADPLFVDAANNKYHLLEDSPCIDAGDPNYIAEPNETDLDGKPRIIGGRIDMGAYESPIFAEARIIPRTINLASKGNWITCYIWLGEDYDVADIDPNNVLLEYEIQPESLRLDEEQQVAIAKFNRSEVQDILSIGEVELTIIGQLTDGTIFEATDVIRVLNKAGQKSAK